MQKQQNIIFYTNLFMQIVELNTTTVPVPKKSILYVYFA